MQPHRLLIASVLTVLSAGSMASVPDAALSTLTAYSAAFNRNDCQEVLRLITPVYVEALRDRNAVGTFCSVLDDMAADGVVDIPGPVQFAETQGPHSIVIFENERMGRSGIRFIAYYAVHSSDGGRTWRVLDNGCDQEEWLRKIYPPYSGAVKLPPQRTLLPPYLIR